MKKLLFEAEGNFNPKVGKVIYFLLYIFILVSILSSRIYKLASDPPGLFFDESSIGFNAISILKTGYDEHGVYLPLYFESVGDFKNPIYIYTVAGVFSIFTPSEFTLRSTSILFFGMALFFLLVLVSKVFNKNRVVDLYALTLFGFLPLFFVLSRIAFEVISQLCLVSLFTLLVWLSFQGDEGKSTLIYAGVAGVVLGVSTYSYTTQRLLSVLMLVIIWVVYVKRVNLKRLFLLTLSFILFSIPLLFFMYSHPGVVTARFNELSFLDDNLRLIDKIYMFIANYAKYWSLDYLVIHGDPNLRHSTGYGGVTYISIIVLFIAGLFMLAWKARNAGRFPVFLLANMIVSPIPAAMITEGTPHALRSMLTVYYILLISCYALDFLSKASFNPAIKISGLAVLALLCGYEISNYLRDYYFYYPARSVEAMDSFDFRSALEFALEQNPSEIVVAGLSSGGYAHFQFYSSIVSNPQNVPLTNGDIVAPSPGICILYNRRMGIEGQLDASPLPYEGFSSRSKLNSLEKRLDLEKFGGVIKARCYHK